MSILFTKIDRLRKEKFQLRTSIITQGSKIVVVKEAQPPSFDHLERLVFNQQRLEKKWKQISFPKILSSSSSSVTYEYLAYPFLASQIEDALYESDYEKANRCVELYLNLFSLLPVAQYNSHFREFSSVFDPKGKYPYTTPERYLIFSNLDLNFDNIFFDESSKSYTVIDSEWCFDFPVPTNYIKFRALIDISLKLQSLISINCNKVFPLISISQNLFIPQSWFKLFGLSFNSFKEFFEYEKQFQSVVMEINSERDFELFEAPIHHTNLITDSIHSQRSIDNYDATYASYKQLTDSRLYSIWSQLKRVKRLAGSRT